MKALVYSSDGRRYAVASQNEVSICDADSSQELQRLPLTGVIDIKFSPKGTWIATWERYVKPTVEGTQHKNMRLWDIATGEEVASFSQKSQEGWCAPNQHYINLIEPISFTPRYPAG